MAKYVMIIDKRRCIGCHTCSVACKLEYNQPDGVWYTEVVTEGGVAPNTPKGSFVENNLSMNFYTKACQHCDNPPCVPVCPTAATWKREDGPVVMDIDLCIGCGSCVEECPYEARVLMENSSHFISGSVGDSEASRQRDETVGKCSFCTHRVDKGSQPFCVEVCPMQARVFGDISDKKIAGLLKARRHNRLAPELGTGPSVYFLDASGAGK